MKNLAIIKLNENRCRRNYFGGKVLDEIRGRENAEDGICPEEWVGSLTLSSGTGLEEVENEGLSFFTKGEEDVYLLDEIKSNPSYYLGEGYLEKHGFDLGFLCKFIDSSIRLHLQAHPTREFAKKYLDCEYGKFECYYILSMRKEGEGYIRLGFQKDVTKEEFTQIVLDQDLAKMDTLFEKIPVHTGEMLYIPGGTPHAIGEGVLLVEVMEPSDLVVRCEYAREGIVIPEVARMMGRSVEFCMDIFDYTKYTPDQIRENFFVEPANMASCDGYTLDRMLSSDIAGSFEVLRVQVSKECEVPFFGRPVVLIGTKGTATIACGEDNIQLGFCENAFVAASAKTAKITPADGEFEMLLVLPKEDK